MENFLNNLISAFEEDIFLKVSVKCGIEGEAFLLLHRSQQMSSAAAIIFAKYHEN